jgi:hypothetical protein
MDVLALVVSTIALIVSGFAAWYTRRQAHAAEGTLELDRKRELERWRPPVEIRLTRWVTHPKRLLELEIESKGTRALESATLQILNEGSISADEKGNLLLNPDTHDAWFHDDNAAHSNLYRKVVEALEPGIVRTAYVYFWEVLLPSDLMLKLLATYRTPGDERQERADLRVPDVIPKEPKR